MRKQVHNMYEDGSLVQSIKKGGWKKQAKKVIASVMAAAMVITGSAVVSPQSGAVVEAAEEDPIILKSNQWWSGTGISKNLTITGDGEASFYIGCIEGVDGNFAFSAEMSSGKKFITSGTDGNIWTVDEDNPLPEGGNGPIAGSTVEGAEFGTFTGIIQEGHQYKVTATRSSNDFTLVYYDVTANEEFHQFAVKNADMGAEVNFHVMMQVGTYLVGEGEFAFEKKNLTVNCVDEEGNAVHDPVTEQLYAYTDYSITAPEVTGYAPELSKIEGKMPNEDKTIDLVYKRAGVHKVTLNYVMPEGVAAPEPVSKEVSEGVEYSIPVPEVEGCKPDKKVVTGTMGEEDIEVTVTYSKSLNYTISGQWNALGAGYQVKVKKNFDIDFNFHNAGGNNNWENYGVALDMNATVGTWASGWFLRADRWSNLTITEPTYALVDCSWGSWDDGDSWWTTFRDVMKDANVVVNVKRVSDIITITNNITGANGETLIWTAVANNCPTERMAITLCCESPAKATIDSVTDNSAEGNGFLTEDDLKNDTSSSNNNNTFVPVITPSPAPTASPSAEPSESPSVEPTVAPSTEPTTEPTVAPTTEPTVAPTVEPTTEPTDEPSNEPSVNKGDKVTSSKVTYTVTNVKSKTVSYQKDKKVSTKKTVSVPATVKVNGETYKVTTVAKNAFANAKKLTSVTVGKNITKIGDTAFKGCGKLTTITIKSTKLTSVGKNVLKGTSKKLVIKVPASKVAAYKKLFKGKGNNSVVIKKA